MHFEAFKAKKRENSHIFLKRKKESLRNSLPEASLMKNFKFLFPEGTYWKWGESVQIFNCLGSLCTP